MNQDQVAASKALAGKLAECVRAAKRLTDAVCTIVYLPSPEDHALHASAVAGASPAIFNIPETIPMSGTEPSAEAFRTGRTVTIGGSRAAPSDAGPKATLYTVTSMPLLAGGHPRGTLSLIRIPWRDGPLTETPRGELTKLTGELAISLASLAEQGLLGEAVPRRPLICPQFPRNEPMTDPAPSWGLPTVPGSTGLSWIYQLHQLTQELNGAAVGMQEVAATARKRIMENFGAATIMIVGQADDRFWIMGHSGHTPEATHQIHGSSAVRRDTPLADVMHGSKAYLYPDRDSLARSYPEARTDESAATAYLPMRVSGRTVGVCCLGWTEPRRFDEEMVDVMKMAANHLGAALERTQLTESEHALAERLQRQLLPRRLPEIPGLALAARYIPALPDAGVGGDWFDAVALPRDRVAMIVGDVEGHSAESAAVMGQLRSAVLASALAVYDHGPAAVLTQADALLRRLDTDLMATCCIVCLDIRAGIVRVANAGHPAPMIHHPDGRIQVLNDSIGVPLGLPVPAAHGDTFDIHLEPGAVVFLYSDGISDASDLDTVASARHKLASAVGSNHDAIDGIVERLAQTAPAPLRDDVVILASQYQGSDPNTLPEIRCAEIQRHDLHGVGAARRVMEACLESWDSASAIDTANLILSELVTNALIHADSDVDIRIIKHTDRVRLEVLDYDIHPPIPSTVSMQQ